MQASTGSYRPHPSTDIRNNPQGGLQLILLIPPLRQPSLLTDQSLPAPMLPLCSPPGPRLTWPGPSVACPSASSSATIRRYPTNRASHTQASSAGSPPNSPRTPVPTPVVHFPGPAPRPPPPSPRPGSRSDHDAGGAPHPAPCPNCSTSRAPPIQAITTSACPARRVPPDAPR